MRDFNLEEAKAGAKVCTRNGLSARIIDWGEEDDDYPIFAEVIDGEWNSKGYYTREGRMFSTCSCHPWDLMMEE